MHRPVRSSLILCKSARTQPKRRFKDIPINQSEGFRKRRIQALAKGISWQDPPIVKEIPIKSSGSRKPPLSVGSGGRGGNNGGWDSDWGDSGFDEKGFGSLNNKRRNQTMGDLRTSVSGGGMSARSRSTDRNWRHMRLERRDFLHRGWQRTSRDLRDCCRLKEATFFSEKVKDGGYDYKVNET
ncbi:hypothetical protein L2E82_52472 [Cichorium intybus]|nr:hypothetical protein L2E82_52472 [Cichorium intybus]